MTQQPCDRILVRDRQRSLSWQGCDEWDRTTMLACLASDPRSLDELALAWARYRPDQPLMELEWHEASSEDEARLYAGEWLAIDLASQRYAWRGPEEIASAPGCCEPDNVNVDGRNQLAWMNLPPWWQEVSPEQWTLAVDEQAAGGLLPRRLTRLPLDFRGVLYGRPLLKYIAEQARACRPPGEPGRGRKRDQPKLARNGTSAADDQRACSPEEFTAQEHAQVRRWEKVTKQIHGRWLMTPRAELGDERPRKFLHTHREWKDRELDHRRSQWSRERRPPPPVPRSSELFRYGPMGTEEVMSYFDLCRQLIRAALQWVDDEPQLGSSELIERLEQLRDGWLATESLDGDGLTVQEVIDGERRLVPRVAKSDPIDCDCPLCRIQELEPEMFGPAFSMYDSFREDMEEEFAFSLHAKREDWERARDEWLTWPETPGDEHESLADVLPADVLSMDRLPVNESQGPAHDELSGGEVSHAAGVDGDWTNVWQTSYSAVSHGDPRLSLLSIGAHLGEIIAALKELAAAREEIDQLNCAFDELTRSIRRWLAREPTGGHTVRSTSTEQAAGQMIQLLEGMALKHPELTARSADLQSQIHQWQRQLALSLGG